MLDLTKTESGPLTNADASDAGRRPEKLSDSKTEKDCVAPIDSTGGPKGVPDVTRKFLTRHRKLMGKLTKMQKNFKLCSTLKQFNSCSTNFDMLKSSFASYCTDLELRDGANNKKCIRMLRCIRKPCPHAAPHRIQTQLSSRCTAPHRKLNFL